MEWVPTERKLADKVIPNIVLYDYNISRAGQVAVNYLEGYDGYSGMLGARQTQVNPCKKAMGKHKSGKVDWALNHIQKLYRIETQIKDKTIGERYRIRQEMISPLLAQFKTWPIKS